MQTDSLQSTPITDSHRSDTRRHIQTTQHSRENKDGISFWETKDDKIDYFLEEGDTRIIPADFEKFSSSESMVYDNTFHRPRFDPAILLPGTTQTHHRSELLIGPESIFQGRKKNNKRAARPTLPGGMLPTIPRNSGFFPTSI